jgi:hypothetical protein
MNIRAFAFVISVLSLSASDAFAQTLSQAPKPTPPSSDQPAQSASPSPTLHRARTNVKVDLTLTDQGPAGSMKETKTISIITADENQGDVAEVPLNVDVTPYLSTDGKIQLNVSLVYDLPSPPENVQAIGRVPFKTTCSRISRSCSRAASR